MQCAVCNIVVYAILLCANKAIDNRFVGKTGSSKTKVTNIINLIINKFNYYFN